MTWLITGIIIFFGVHLVPSNPRFRQSLIQGIGELPYKGIFSVLSLVGLVLIVKGFSKVEYITFWNPSASARFIPPVLMAPALILLVAANFNNNIKRIVRHPMLWGVLLWSVSHLLVNGDLASLVLFGSFAMFALFDMWSANQRGATTLSQPVSMKKDVLAGILGLTAYFLLVMFHENLFGVPIYL